MCRVNKNTTSSSRKFSPLLPLVTPCEILISLQTLPFHLLTDTITDYQAEKYERYNPSCFQAGKLS